MLKITLVNVSLGLFLAASPLAMAEDALQFEFTRELSLGVNSSMVKQETDKSFFSPDYRYRCKITVVLAAAKQGVIAKDRKMSLEPIINSSTYANTYRMVDPNTKKEVAKLVCQDSYSGDVNMLEALESTMGVKPVGGIQKVPVKYDRRENSYQKPTEDSRAPFLMPATLDSSEAIPQETEGSI
jgi:hypothetical protein